MPETAARLRHHRTSPTKVRQVLRLIVGKDVADAREILRFCERGPAETVMKLLDSAVANAEHNDNVPEEELFVARAFADEGPTMKRGVRVHAAGARASASAPATSRSSWRATRTTSSSSGVSARRADTQAQRASRRRRVAGEPARRPSARPPARRSTITITTTTTTSTTRSSSTRSRSTTEVDDTETDDTETDEVEEVETDAAAEDETVETPEGSEQPSDPEGGDDGTPSGERATTRKRRSNGTEGQPVRVPPRHHHRLEVAVVRRGRGVPRAASSRTGRSATTSSVSSSAPR